VKLSHVTKYTLELDEETLLKLGQAVSQTLATLDDTSQKYAELHRLGYIDMLCVFKTMIFLETENL
jgi:hypothetical protein